MNFQEVHYGTYNFISNTVCDYLLLRTVFNSESVTFSASAVEFVNLNTSRSIDLLAVIERKIIISQSQDPQPNHDLYLIRRENVKLLMILKI